MKQQLRSSAIGHGFREGRLSQRWWGQPPILIHQHRQCVQLAENASSASVSMPVVLRFICSANRFTSEMQML
ncbi:MAG: hypothetical protein M3309_15520 [Actinomycetota bacterium]|nr:hypothetical protein [Actinomycetota bacterium]